MNRRTITAAIIPALALLSEGPVLAKTGAPPPELGVNRGVVELETARAAGISVQIAEDLANVIDDGATRRVLPVIGKGAVQNITDLKLLRGIDMAIVQTDVLDYARQQNLFPGIEYSGDLYRQTLQRRIPSPRAARHKIGRRLGKSEGQCRSARRRHGGHGGAVVRTVEHTGGADQRRPRDGARQTAARRDRRDGIRGRKTGADISQSDRQ